MDDDFLCFLIFSNCRFPPGPPTIPILGSIPFIGIGQHPLYVTYTRLAEQYGGVMSIAIGNRYYQGNMNPDIIDVYYFVSK